MASIRLCGAAPALRGVSSRTCAAQTAAHPLACKEQQPSLTQVSASAAYGLSCGVGLRVQSRHQLLYLALRLVTNGIEHACAILGREMRRQQPHRRERQRPIVEPLENERELTGGFDPSIRRVFGETQHLGAVGEERRAAFGQVQPADIERHQKRDELCGGVTFVGDGAAHTREEVSVRHVIESGEFDPHDV